ncbi:MAG: EamA/RhaT family transporter, partial [Burkholderiales bacterium]
MKSRSFLQLLALGAVWGAAFMFMRIAAPEFGAIALAGVRV